MTNVALEKGSSNGAFSCNEEGQLAFDFIQNTANRLALTPEFSTALIREFFDRNAQLYPRHYGVNFPKGSYIWHIVSFGGHYRVAKPEGNTGLDITKYDASLVNIDHGRAYVGKIHASASWTEIDGEKKFSYGGALYNDQTTGFPGIKVTELALSKGRLLIAELINPVSF